MMTPYVYHKADKVRIKIT